MEATKKKLRYIRRTLKAGKLTTEKDSVDVAISEIAQKLREASFQYQVPYVSTQNRSHMQTFKSFGKMCKATLLSNLEELQRETTRPNGDLKRCQFLITEILETDFYRDKVQRKIDRYKPTSQQGVAWQSERITVK